MSEYSDITDKNVKEFYRKRFKDFKARSKKVSPIMKGLSRLPDPTPEAQEFFFIDWELQTAKSLYWTQEADRKPLKIYIDFLENREVHGTMITAMLMYFRNEKPSRNDPAYPSFRAFTKAPYGRQEKEGDKSKTNFKPFIENYKKVINLLQDNPEFQRKAVLDAFETIQRIGVMTAGLWDALNFLKLNNTPEALAVAINTIKNET